MSPIYARKSIFEDTSIWIILAMLSHTAWGAYPVLTRYLQKSLGINTMSLSAVANSFALLLVLIFMRKRVDIRSIKPLDILSYSVVLIVRNTVNLYAARFTYATNVQLFSLLAPIIVAIISTLLYKEALPRHIIKTLILSLVGSLLIIFGGTKNTPNTVENGAIQNWLGISLSMLGGVFMAFLMLEIRRIGKKGASAETLAFYQFVALTIFMTSGSLILREDWNPWFTLPPSGIIAYLAFVFVVLLLGTMLQNYSIKHLGAPAYSTIQAIRLVSTIVFSWIILGEGVETLFQWVGAFIVMGTITWYMTSQKK